MIAELFLLSSDRSDHMENGLLQLQLCYSFRGDFHTEQSQVWYDLLLIVVMLKVLFSVTNIQLTPIPVYLVSQISR